MSATKRPPRVVYNVRLNPDSVEQLQALAETETEGNTSAMIRKLLGEALTARISPRRRS